MASTIIAARLLNRKSGQGASSQNEYQIEAAKTHTQQKPISFKEGFMAWLPFILVFTFILGSSTLIPPVNKALSAIKTDVPIIYKQLFKIEFDTSLIL